MLAKMQKILNKFFIKTRTINDKPLNRMSLLVIFIVDIFILGNVFSGLDEISRWPLSPNQTYSCYSEWKNYQTSTTKDKNYQLINNYVNTSLIKRPNSETIELGHLGKVFPICVQYSRKVDQINNPTDIATVKLIDKKQLQVRELQTANGKIKSEYDSTLLEKIAGQNRGRSINGVSAETAKLKLAQNSTSIVTLDREITTLKTELLAKPASTEFLVLLKNEGNFKEVENSYQQANFWYPSIQLAFQALFLVPLILIALLVNTIAQRKSYGVVSLISWHLLAIFTIPLLIKIFEFLQVGIIFKWIFDLVMAIFGRLLFLINFLYILIIPLVGFGIIKFSQRFVPNPRHIAANRLQLSQCMNCARRISTDDAHCPHCGYYQYIECSNCHSLTYKNVDYCKECGHLQDAHITTPE